jgi:hypothetical protein
MCAATESSVSSDIMMTLLYDLTSEERGVLRKPICPKDLIPRLSRTLVNNIPHH